MKTKQNTLHRELTLQAQTTGGDGMGGGSTTWNDEATVFANIHPLTGKEKLQAHAIDGSISHRITLRPLDGLSRKKRFKLGNRILNIVSVIDKDEQHKYLEVMAYAET